MEIRREYIAVRRARGDQHMTDAKSILPGHETQSTEMNCPSCGRFVGAVTRCPYCGAKVEKRMSLVAIRWAAVLLSTVGMFLLYLMAKHRDIPVVKLGDVKATMNFGQIRVVGTVEEDARTFRNGGMGFNVSDGTGTIMVFVSQKQAKDLVDLNSVPRAGDEIDFAGGLNISDDRSSMRLLSARHVTLTRTAAATVRLADVNDSLIGSSVVLAGKVVGVDAPPADSKRPYDIRIADGTGEQTINCWPAEFEQIESNGELAGKMVRARVSVASYRDKLQLKLSSGMDLEIVDELPPVEKPLSAAQKAAETHRKEQPAQKRDFSRGRLAEAVPIGSITAEHKDQTVKVRGRVASARSPEAGTKQPFSLILVDGDASIRATYWSNADEVIEVKPTVGATFEVEGVVDVYQGKPQLKIESGYRVVQIEAASEAAAPAARPAAGTGPAATVGVGSITAADKGQARAVRGTLGAARSLGKGTAYELKDESGSIDLILWDSTVPAEVRESLSEGATVVAEGIVGEYQGELQIKANRGASVRVVP
jgi:DNA/RNA endonuclease YhcR with UshA esterase domain